jgi:hypothetical protein
MPFGTFRSVSQGSPFILLGLDAVSRCCTFRRIFALFRFIGVFTFRFCSCSAVLSTITVIWPSIFTGKTVHYAFCRRSLFVIGTRSALLGTTSTSLISCFTFAAFAVISFFQITALKSLSFIVTSFFAFSPLASSSPLSSAAHLPSLTAPCFALQAKPIRPDCDIRCWTFYLLSINSEIM